MWRRLGFAAARSVGVPLVPLVPLAGLATIVVHRSRRIVDTATSCEASGHQRPQDLTKVEDPLWIQGGEAAGEALACTFDTYG